MVAIAIAVNGVTRNFTSSTSSAWLEEWSAGTVDIWIASRLVDGALQFEYEFSVRANVPATATITIRFDGVLQKTLTCAITWPAGRLLAGRLGAEFGIADEWETRWHSHFGPTEMPLPDIPDESVQEAHWSDKLTELRAAIAAQTAVDVEDSDDGITTWIGPFAMWEREDPGPGAPGGTGIYHAIGWQDCLSYARLACEVEASYMQRMWAFYNADGTVFSVDQFAVGAAPYCNAEANIKPPPFDAAGASDALWRPIALTHLVRVTRWVGVAYEMTGSRLALRHLKGLAETARLQFSDRGVLDWSPGFIAFNLATYEDLAATFGTDGFNYVQPGAETNSGANWHRGHGWCMWVAAWAMKHGMASSGWTSWATRFIASMTSSQMPNGLIGRYTSQVVGATTHDICAVMHEAIIGLGLCALGKQTGISVTTAVNANSMALYRNVNLTPQVYHGQYGPWHWLHVGLHENASTYGTITTGQSEPTDPTNPGDPLAVEVYIAAMYGRTLDVAWLTAGLSYGFQSATLVSKLADLTASDGYQPSDIMDRSWQAHLFAYLQNYSVSADGGSRTIVVRRAQSSPIRRPSVTRRVQ